MKEFLMHSALMWYLCQKFEDLYSADLKQMEVLRKNVWSKHQIGFGKELEVLSLRFYTVYQLMQSSHLKVDSENLTLGFLFHYTKLVGGNQNVSKNGVLYITDVLASAVRF